MLIRMWAIVDFKLPVATGALLFTLFAFWWNRRASRKALTYNYIISPFTEFNHDFGGSLQITFNQRPVSIY